MQACFKVLSSKHSAPEVSIGTRLKAQEVKVSMVPGPGQYLQAGSVGKQVNSEKISVPSATFGNAKITRSLRPDAGTPGPGAYLSVSSMGAQPLSQAKSHGGFSIGGRGGTTVSKIPILSGPGPGQCREDSSFREKKSIIVNATPHFKFGSEVRSKWDIKDTPGPGAYNSNRSLIKKSKFTLGGRNKIVVDRPENLGPGRCRTDSSFTPEPRKGFKFNSRLPLYVFTDIPGPGAYGGGIDGVPSGGGGLQRSSSPGSGSGSRPGSRSRSPGFSFGSSRQRPLPDRRVVPAPGEYEGDSSMGKQPLRKTNPIFSLGGARSSGSPVRGPGPGAYRPDSATGLSGASSPSFSFASRHTFGAIDGSPSLGPGPSLAHGDVEPVLRRALTPGLGRAARLRDFSTPVPGPGTYSAAPSAVGSLSVASVHRSPPAFSLASRHERRTQVNNVVGPNLEESSIGHQLLSGRRSAPGSTWASGTGRDAFAGAASFIGRDTLTPGPGTYG